MQDEDYERSVPVERNEDEIKKRKIEFRDLCLKVKGQCGNMRFYINPLSTSIGAVLIWAIIIWALVDHDESIKDINSARRWITDKCTWFYIGSQFIWPILLVVIYFKFGHIKLGLSDDLADYRKFDFFCMVFTTGICTGFFYDSVNFPLAAYQEKTDNFLIYRGKDNYVTKAVNSLNVVMYHWGFHGLGVYIIPSLLMSILAYRKGLPLTMRTCFYPVFGRKIFGRLGDLVDGVSLICIAFGVSTSFMFGSLLLISGLREHNDDLESSRRSKIIALWCICFCGFVSAATGIRLGIRRISQLTFITSAFFTITVALSDNIWYLLNLIIQSLGHYAQFIIGTSTFTGAFIQEGTYPDAEKYELDWVNENTVFYWGWWLGWAPLVSMFIARISKGQSIKNTILYGYFIPCCMSFIWFAVIGGVVIDTENRALSLNLTCNSSSLLSNQTAATPAWIQRLGCIGDKEARFYTILEKYGDISDFLKIIAFIITVLYFVTSIDSSALVMASISSNGEEDPPLIQRAFWCATLGAVTTVLIVYKENVGENQVGGFTVIAGLPFAVIECLCAIGLWRLLRAEPNWSYELIVKWKMLYGNINSILLLKQCCFAIFVPWYFLGYVYIKEKDISKIYFRVLSYMAFAIPFYLWIILLFLRLEYDHINNVAWSIFIGFLVFSGTLRRKIRNRKRIPGNIFEDVTLMVIFPLTSVQMFVECQDTPVSRPEGQNIGVSNTGSVDMIDMSIKHNNDVTQNGSPPPYYSDRVGDVAEF